MTRFVLLLFLFCGLLVTTALVTTGSPATPALQDVTETPPSIASATPTTGLTVTLSPTVSVTVAPTHTSTATAAAPTVSPTLTSTFTATATPTVQYMLYAPVIARIAPDYPEAAYLRVYPRYPNGVILDWQSSQHGRWYVVQRGLDSSLRDAQVVARLDARGTHGSGIEDNPPPGHYYYAVDVVNLWGLSRSNIETINVLPTLTPTITPSPTPDTEIYGRLSDRQASHIGVGGLKVQLRLHDGENVSTVAETFSAVSDDLNVHGFFWFRNLPGTQQGQSYQVIFPNAERNPEYIGAWYGSRYVLYSGLRIPVGLLLCGVSLLSPEPDADVDLPSDFIWQRNCPASDGYRILLYEPGDGGRAWITNEVTNYGGPMRLTIHQRPEGVGYRQPLVWTVLINYNPSLPENYGIAFEARRFRFVRSDDDKIEQVERAGMPGMDVTWQEVTGILRR